MTKKNSRNLFIVALVVITSMLIFIAAIYQVVNSSFYSIDNIEKLGEIDNSNVVFTNDCEMQGNSIVVQGADPYVVLDGMKYIGNIIVVRSNSNIAGSVQPRLYIDYGEGFSENDSFSATYIPHSNEIYFEVKKGTIAALRLDVDENCEIEKIETYIGELIKESDKSCIKYAILLFGIICLIGGVLIALSSNALCNRVIDWVYKRRYLIPIVCVYVLYYGIIGNINEVIKGKSDIDIFFAVLWNLLIFLESILLILILKRYTSYFSEKEDNKYSYIVWQVVIFLVCGAELIYIITDMNHDNYWFFSLSVTAWIYLLLNMIYFLVRIYKDELHKIFFVLAIGIGILFVFLIPPYVTPDESRHIEGAYYVSDRIMNYEIQDDYNIELRYCEIWNGIEGTYVSRGYYNNFFGRIFEKATKEANQTMISGVNPPRPTILYLIPAIGVTIARLFHANIMITFILGTLCSLFFYVLCATYAIKKIPFCKEMILVFSFFPMTLQQTCSFSYDNIVLSAIVIIMALAIKWNYGTDKRITKSELLIYAVAAFFMLIAKGSVYFVYVFIPILLNCSKDKMSKLVNKYKKILPFLIAIILIILLRNQIVSFVSVVFNRIDNSSVIQNVEVDGYENYIAWNDSEGYTIGYLLRHPLQLAMILVNTVGSKLDFYFNSMIGNSLGWFQISIPQFIIVAFVMLFVFSLFKQDDEIIYINNRDRMILILMAIFSGGACAAAMLLCWTPRGFNCIEGVQGRYFLPTILGVGLSLRNTICVLKKKITNYLVYGVSICSMVTILYILIFSK